MFKMWSYIIYGANRANIIKIATRSQIGQSLVASVAYPPSSVQTIKTTGVKLKRLKRFSSRKGAEFLQQITFVPTACWTNFTDGTPAETAKPLKSVFEMPSMA